ncbi:MAG TPA: TIGR00730 family Rossman fold protein [Ignavibacteria bacterium]|nr:TIGR00730 family Rossman fold protein [Ignavibacteria bacterium]
MKNHLEKAPKAYNNTEFLGSPAGRVIRLISEYQEPLERLKKNNIRDTIVFFGSARLKSPEDAKKEINSLKKQMSQIQPEQIEEKKRLLELMETADYDLKNSKYYADTEELSYMLTKWSISLKNGNKFVVTSGGGPGIMEAANRGARRAKGHTIGFNISLPFEQYPNKYINEELNFEFHYFFMRKFWLAYLAKAVVIMPGGYGTLDELMEVLTLVQTNKLRKNMAIVIYGKDFWDQILDFNALVKNNVIAKNDLNLFRFANTPEEAFDYLKKSLLKNYVNIL